MRYLCLTKFVVLFCTVCCVCYSVVYYITKHVLDNTPKDYPNGIIFKTASSENQCDVLGFSYYINKLQNNVNPSEDVLHVMTSSRQTYSGLYLYRGYYDDREDVRKLRITGMIHRENLGSINDRLFCYIWIPNASSAAVVRASGFTIWQSYGDYQAVLLSCNLTSTHSQTIPSFVTIADTKCAAPTNFIPIEIGSKPRGDHSPNESSKIDVGVCLKVLYGRPDPIRLIEWLELNLLLGASTIYVYGTSLDSTTLEILRYYQNLGKVVLQNHSFPQILSKQILKAKFPTRDYYQNWELELLSMTDCIYTGKEKYLLNIDVDEVIFASNFSTITGYLKYREKYFTPVASVVFHTGVYSDEFEIKDDKQLEIPTYMHTLRHNIRTKIDWESPKSVLRRDSCIAPGHHLCLHPLEGIPQREDEKEAVGHVRHYRHECRLTGELNKCAKLLSDPHTDNSLLFLRDELDKVVSKVLQRFNLK